MFHDKHERQQDAYVCLELDWWPRLGDHTGARVVPTKATTKSNRKPGSNHQKDLHYGVAPAP
jgi:hypothetical protein